MATRSFSFLGCLLGVSALLVGATPVHASEDGPATSDVTGGVSSSKACAYPSLALLYTYEKSDPKKRFGCTGTLIHPRVILYAAHCKRISEIRFTENQDTPGQLVLKEEDIEKQKTNPRYGGTYDQAHDWAYAVLKKPLTNIPLIPMAAGCERAMLQKRGQEVYFAGFSPNESKAKGETRLRWAKTSITGGKRGTIEAGGRRVTACGGDSGGPMLAKVDDGSWRTLGVASTLAKGCGTQNGYNTYAKVNKEMTAWIEQETGIDVTPCADDNGQPTPSLACDELMAYSEMPSSPTGTRPNNCSEAKVLPAKNACNVPDSGEKKDDEGKEDEGKEDEGKEDEGKEDEGKEDEGKEDEGKEDEGKEDEGKEDEDKEDEGKEDEGQESGEEDKEDEGQESGDGDKEDEGEESGEGDSEGEDNATEDGDNASEDKPSDGEDKGTEDAGGNDKPSEDPNEVTKSSGCALQEDAPAPWALASILLFATCLRRSRRR